MTEAEWLAGIDPEPMVEFMRGKGSDRKLRLFGVACCRRIWELVDQRHHRLAEMTELYADGKATREQIAEPRHPADDPEWTPGHAFELAAEDDVDSAAVFAPIDTAHAAANKVTGLSDIPRKPEPAWFTAYKHELVQQTALLRDIFGNPFRPVCLDEIWLWWSSSTLPKMAQMIYDDRAFHRLPILADALEEAGCTDQTILDHCRGPGPHVRGCWVVDLILGKN
jgi:hypothetical protein